MQLFGTIIPIFLDLSRSAAWITIKELLKILQKEKKRWFYTKVILWRINNDKLLNVIFWEKAVALILFSVKVLY